MALSSCKAFASILVTLSTISPVAADEVLSGPNFVDAPAPVWVQSIRPGTWSAVSHNTLADVDPARDPSVNPDYPNAPPWRGSTGQQSVINAWNGGAFARDVGRLGSLLAFGGGHGNYFGNEIYAFDLENRTWSRVTDPFVASKEVLTAFYEHAEFPDGSPVPPHTYDYVDYHPGTRSFIVLRGLQQLYIPSGPVSNGPAHVFSFNDRRWRRGPIPAGPYRSTGWSTYDSRRDLFWVNPPNGPAGFRSFDPNARGEDGIVGAWSRAYSPRKKGRGDGLASYDPVRDLIVYTDFASSPGVVYALDMQDPAADPVALRDEDRPSNLARGHGWEWSNLRGAMIYWPRTGGAEVHELRCGTRDWRKEAWLWNGLTVPDNEVIPQSMTKENGVYSRFRIVTFQDAEVALVFNRVDGPVYAFRIPHPSRSHPSAPRARVGE